MISIQLYYSFLLSVPSEFGTIKKEQFNNWYKLRTYYVAFQITNLPIQVGEILDFIAYLFRFPSNNPKTITIHLSLHHSSHYKKVYIFLWFLLPITTMYVVSSIFYDPLSLQKMPSSYQNWFVKCIRPLKYYKENNLQIYSMSNLQI